ncbi:MAG: hypothetical protein ACRC2T_14610, partial [Thermoguttaceae bacterium]
MKRARVLLLLFFLLLSAQVAFAQTNANADSHVEKTTVQKNLDFKPYDLRVEYMKSPIGIEESVPRFSWKIQTNTRGEAQTAYRIVVEKQHRQETVWDSGKVESSKMVGAEYAGQPLEPKTAYTWTVTTWNKSGKESSSVQSRFT